MIEVNGVKYERIIHEKKESKPMSKTLAAAMMMTLPYTMYDGLGGSNYNRPLPNVDIVEEFGLIEQKKSKLSRWERDQVVRIFNNNYKKI